MLVTAFGRWLEKEALNKKSCGPKGKAVPGLEPGCMILNLLPEPPHYTQPS